MGSSLHTVYTHYKLIVIVYRFSFLFVKFGDLTPDDVSYLSMDREHATN